LLDEGRIELRNFGIFAVKRRRARQGRNPRTGASVVVPPKTVATFKPGREMKQRVQQLSENPGPT
jgi:nucleoid DNA-binding protein